MEKTEECTNRSIIKGHNQNISHRKKSPKAEQSNKISTWLSKNVKEYPSINSSTKNNTKLLKCEGDKLKISNRNTRNSDRNKESCKDKMYNRREGKSRDETEKQLKLDSDQSKNEIKRRKSKSKENDGKSKDGNGEPSIKKYKSDKVSTRLTEEVKKKDDRKPGSSRESNKKDTSKKSEGKIKSREGGESDRKRQKLDLHRSKKIEGTDKGEDKKRGKNGDAESSNKKNKFDKVERGQDKTSATKKSRHKADENKSCHSKQKNLDNFVKKTPKNKKSKTKFSHTDSSESCDFPSFENVTKRSNSNRVSESFKKYGVDIPSIEEILKDKKDLELYRTQLEAFEQIKHQSFDLPFSIKDLNRTEVNCVDILGCKHLTTEQITEAFKRHLLYIADIFHGRKYNERHNRFFDNKNKSYTLTSKDLTYSTSMVVFNFDQIEHMIKMLEDEFDPDDKWTPYFFQVLLPELCLRIFMDVHGMSYEEAVKYLDVRPITND